MIFFFVITFVFVSTLSVVGKVLPNDADIFNRWQFFCEQVDEIAKRKDKKKPEFDDMMKNGKGLVGKKDVTDTGPCKETIKELEEKWRELADILGERQNQNRARKQSLNAYEALREQVRKKILLFYQNFPKCSIQLQTQVVPSRRA